jgi:hypothetical protein
MDKYRRGDWTQEGSSRRLRTKHNAVIMNNIWRFREGKISVLAGYTTVQGQRWLPPFRMNLLSSSQRCKQSKLCVVCPGVIRKMRVWSVKSGKMANQKRERRTASRSRVTQAVFISNTATLHPAAYCRIMPVLISISVRFHGCKT